MLVLWIYLVGWAAATVYFCVTMQPDANRRGWLTVVACCLLFALASLWPLLAVLRIALAIWHRLDHPGAARMLDAITAKDAPVRSCTHAAAVPFSDKAEWCSTCGSVREKPLPWIPCVRQGGG